MRFILILCELLEMFDTSGRTSKPPKRRRQAWSPVDRIVRMSVPMLLAPGFHPRTRGLDELIREVGITRRGLYLSDSLDGRGSCHQVNGRSSPAIFTPVKAEASNDRARKSSVSRLCTEDFPHAFASMVISIAIAVRKR